MGSMSSKLLKVFVAVMLVAGAGEVLCQGDGASMDMDATSSGGWQQNSINGSVQPSKKRKWEDDGWKDSVSAIVKCEVQAIVKVKSGENEKELNLFDVNGDMTHERERTFNFQVLSIGAGGTVSVTAGPGMMYTGQEGRWNIFAEESDNTIGNARPFVEAVLEMYDGNGDRVELDNNNSVSIGVSDEFDKEKSWKLILKPLPLRAGSVKGKYVGNLVVKVTSNG